MSTLALIQVQKALYGKLVGDGVLMGMVSGVFDSVPQKTAYPYVVIGDGTQALQAADAVEISQCRLEMHVWTEAGGRKTALTILNRIHALMHLGTLHVSGFDLMVLRTEQASVSMAEDATSIHGRLTLAVMVVEQ